MKRCYKRCPKSKRANLKTVQKLEESGVKLQYNFKYGNVSTLRCTTCKRWEQHILLMENVSSKQISPDASSITKDYVKNHANSLRHQEGLKLTLKNELGREACKKKKEKPYSDYPAFLFLLKKKRYRHWKTIFEQPRCSRLYLSCF